METGLGVWGPLNAGLAQKNANGKGSYTLNATAGGGWAWTNNLTGEELEPEAAAEIGLTTPDDAFTPAQRATVEAAVRRATEALKRNKQCAALFHQAGASTLANTSYNGIWSANGLPTASTAEDSRSVGINVNGSFFGPPTVMYLGFLRPGGISIDIMQDVVIWHELGHELASVTGFMADGPGDEFGKVKSWVNTLRVLNNCIGQ